MGEFLYLLSGLVLGLIVFIGLFKVNKILACILGIIFGLTGVPFAFIKPRGYSIFKYYKYKMLFQKKEKKLPNKRKI